MRAAGACQIDVARTQEERTAQWEARHHLYWAVRHLYPGRTYVITDTAVPLSHMPEMVSYTQDLLAELGLEGGVLGHVGDGNLHTLIAATADEQDRAEMFSTRLVQRALELGGTATGEHGIGLAKRQFMAAEHGPALAWMQRLKALFDPDGLLNPGKIV
jgi:D-lactate dehydrogenase (cytochrome)